MECNKEEAMRAKELAEKKMQNKDFIAARNFVLRAQQLFPVMENISQMLTVCNVHCSAAVKLNGELDWYGILQVESTADDSSIKKQYRKLALLLHPDKNQFAGAEAAFKLIREAHELLSDRSKRSVYDLKRNSKTINPLIKKPTQASRMNPQSQTNFTNVTFVRANQQQKQPSGPSSGQTFWTICHVCGIRYQYYISILNRSLRCQNCLNTFIAYDLNAKVVPSAGNPLSSRGNKEKIPTQPAHNVNQRQFGNAPFAMGSYGDAGGMKQNASTPAAERSAKQKQYADKREHDNHGDAGGIKQNASTLAAERSARQKQYAVKREHDNHGDAGGIKQNASTPAAERSARQKQYAVKREHDNHDNTRGARKKFKSESSCNDNVVNLKENGTGVANNSHCGSASVLGSFSYLDPEFGNFDKLRDACKFTVNQIWAIYDNQDGMPRFYARIRKVCLSDFIVYFTWLEYNPLNENEATWTDAELPVACGNFRLGVTEYTSDKLIFSHVVSWKQGKKKKSYEIYPRKGEVWALFKGWDMNWSSNINNDRSYEYEVVEVLSDFDLGRGICIIPLVRMDHYVSLFRRASEKELSPKVIPPGEILRFSHYIPSYRSTGIEKEGIPEGSLELHCAALPSNFKEMFPPVNSNSSTIRSVELGGNSESCLKFTVDNMELGDDVIQKRQSMTIQDVLYDGTNRSDVEQNHVNGDTDLKDEHEESGAKISDVETHDEGNPDVEKVNDTISDGDKVDGEQNGMNESTDLKNGKNVETVAKIPVVEIHDSGNSDVEKANDTVSDDANNSSVSSSSPTVHQYPDPEFYNFEQGKTVGTVQRGQIWALYSDVDTYPKYYGFVKGVDLENFSVDIAWLEACPMEEEEKLWWFDQDMPLGCGIFKVTRQIVTYNDTNFFSHCVKAQLIGKKKHYIIQPCVDEIWAVYRNWGPGWSLSELKTCKYLVVEICECTDAGTKVNILTKVNGYKSVFRREENRNVVSSMEIPVNEYIKFSHQIPAFRLTDERDGKLRGYWELDPASVPTVLS